MEANFPLIVGKSVEWRNGMNKRQRAFSLVELLVVLVIIGILLSIVIPSYNEYMRKAARAQAKSLILDMAQMEERFFTNNATYLAIAAPPAAVPAGWQNYSGADSPSRKYDVTVTAGATGSIATSFVITATPANGFSDSTCGTLTLASDGAKTASGTGACW